jgi:protease I
MKAVLIIAKKGYQDVEYGNTRKGLEEAGIEVTVAGSEVGDAEGGLGGSTTIDKAMSEIQVDDFDAVVYIGGPGASGYQQDPEAHRIAKEAVEKGKILAAICIAPTILAYAGVLGGKKATTWDDGQKTQATILENNGAVYTGEDVTQDGKLITANGPNAADKFGKTIASALSS